MLTWIVRCLVLAVIAGLSLGVAVGLVTVLAGWIVRRLWPVEEDEDGITDDF